MGTASRFSLVPRHVRWLVVLLLLWSDCGYCPAALPGATDPNVFTDREFRQATLDFNRRSLIEAYRAVGQRDPRWDEPAEQLLEYIALYFSNAGAQHWSQLPNVPRREEMVASGKAALEAGCSDPLVIYCYGVVLDDMKFAEEAKGLLQRSADALFESSYPANRALGAYNRLLKYVDTKQDPAEFQRLSERRRDTLLAVFTLSGFEGLDRRMIVKLYLPEFGKLSLDDRRVLYEDAQKLEGDKWLLNILGGEYHIEAGWDARGRGWAHTVTPEGWAGLKKHLGAARACLLEAYRLEPTYPEAATKMITVVMGGVSGPGESERVWLDRAVKGQLDYAEAYSTYLQARWPRWGGSHAEMLAFGRECVATKRFDTRVPFVLLDALNQINSDMGETHEIWQRPGVYPALKQMLEGYLSQPELAPHKAWYHSYYAALSWRVGDYATGVKQFEALDGQTNAFGFSHLAVWPQRASSGAHAMTSSRGVAIRAAERHAAAGRIDPAIKAFDAIELEPEHPGSWYLRSRCTELAWQKQFETGAWVDLQPEKDLEGWYALQGSWSVDEHGAVIGEAGDRGMLLVRGGEFGKRYELQAVVEILPSDAPQPNAGVWAAYTDHTWDYHLLLRPQERVVELMRSTTRDWRRAFETQPSNQIVVKVWDQHFDGTVNDQHVYSKLDMRRYVPTRPTWIGIGADRNNPGMKIRFREIKIRKLASQP